MVKIVEQSVSELSVYGTVPIAFEVKSILDVKHQGCVLGSINRYAYTEFPDEVELIWCKDLTGA